MLPSILKRNSSLPIVRPFPTSLVPAPYTLPRQTAFIAVYVHHNPVQELVR
jgi:hypothetical protein